MSAAAIGGIVGGVTGALRAADYFKRRKAQNEQYEKSANLATRQLERTNNTQDSSRQQLANVNAGEGALMNNALKTTAGAIAGDSGLGTASVGAMRMNALGSVVGSNNAARNQILQSQYASKIAKNNALTAGEDKIDAIRSKIDKGNIFGDIATGVAETMQGVTQGIGMGQTVSDALSNPSASLESTAGTTDVANKINADETANYQAEIAKPDTNFMWDDQQYMNNLKKGLPKKGYNSTNLHH